MKHINEKKQWAQLVFVLIPLTLSLVFYYFDNILILTAAVLSLFLLVSILPVCKKRENLWMFIFPVFRFSRQTSGRRFALRPVER